MGLRYYYRDNDGVLQELVGSVRRMTLSAAASAEEGSVGTWEVTVDDPEATFEIRGHRRFQVVEDAAEGDPYGGVVWAGYTGDRDVERGVFRAGETGRQWKLHLHDANTILDQRIFVGGDADRPAETDLERVVWALNTNEMLRVSNDETYIDQFDGVAMDAVDYEGQKVIDVIDDCAQQSGRNYFLFWLDSGESDPVEFFLWYKFAASSNYTSQYRISNDLDDVDQTTIFAPDHEMRLTRSPSRVYSGVFQAYDGGNVYVQRQETVEKFITRDTTGHGQNVKTRAKAISRANRYLRDNKEELDTIACSVVVDGGRINGFMQGHRTFIKATHLPGYTSEFRPMRIRDRTVHEIGPDVYEIAMVLTGPSLEDLGDSGDDTDDTVFATLNRPGTPLSSASTGAGGVLYWGSSGDENKAGWPHEPTTGLLSIIEDPTPPLAPWPFTGILVEGDGTLDRIELLAFTAGIPHLGTCTVTWAILQNGATIAEETEVVTGGLYFWGSRATVIATNVSVANGDIIEASVTSSPPMPYFRVPSGTGGQDERLRIIGGSLA